MKPGWKRFVLGILSPMLLAVALFAGVAFGLILPALERSTIERKREMIRELTVSAWGILDECEQQVRDGKLDRAAAHQLAVDQVRRLRYGAGGKDYFWITDVTPRMIMHPYRPDLEGQDLSSFRDPDGNLPFVNFVRIACAQGEGYSAYRWQVREEADHIAPKLSFIKYFAPWEWIIGTGLYVEDVQAESRRQTTRLAQIGLSIFGLATVMLLGLTRQSYRIERDRQAAERSLRESEQRYRALVESAGEGMMVASEGRVVFMNRPLRALLQRAESAVWPALASDLFEGGLADRPTEGAVTTRLKDSRGEWLLVSLTITSLPEPGRELLYTIRDLRSETVAEKEPARRIDDLSALLDDIRNARAPEEIQVGRRRLADLIRLGHAQGLHGSILTRQMADVADAAVENCCQRALRDLGPAPVPFAFLAFGSEGRREASLLTDQDNGIIYADPNPDQAVVVADYFARFADRVCGELVRAGWPLCNGGLMASNPEWRMTTSQWGASVKKWSLVGNRDSLKGINVVADHRCSFGDESLCGVLREALHAATQGSQAFYFNLAKAALGYRPPLESLGRWSPERGTATINLKDALTPVVNLARIYALRHGLSLISTPARLRALAEQGGLSKHEVPSLVTTFEFMLRLRVQRHLELAESGGALDDQVLLASLSELDHATLRHALELTDRMQNHLRLDFCQMQA